MLNNTNYKRGIRLAALRKKNADNPVEESITNLGSAMKAIGRMPEEMANKFSKAIILTLDVNCKASVKQFVDSVAAVVNDIKKAA